jgi:hypothetical protein
MTGCVCSPLLRVGIALAIATILLVVPMLAWRWRRAGGMLLVLEGLGLLGFVGPSTAGRLDALLSVGLALPPLVVGLLLSTDHSKPTRLAATQA